MHDAHNEYIYNMNLMRKVKWKRDASKVCPGFILFRHRQQEVNAWLSAWNVAMRSNYSSTTFSFIPRFYSRRTEYRSQLAWPN